jgi:hypothetical protein
MSTSATIRLYELLRVKLGDEDARSFVEQFVEAIQENSRQNHDVICTASGSAKQSGGLFMRMAESRSVMNKWMFIFWIGGISLELGLVIAFAKCLVH